MPTSPALVAAGPDVPRQTPFLLYSCENVHSAREPECLTSRMRLGEGDRRKAVNDCILCVVLALIAPPIMPVLLVPLLCARRELRRIRDQRLLVSGGRVLDGEVVSCRGRRTRGPHEDSDDYYEVAVRYAFHTPEGHRIIGSAELARDDLRNAQLPKSGAEVRVLYLNEKNYRLL